MQISEMNTEQFLNLCAVASEIIPELLEDKKVLKAYEKYKSMNSKEMDDNTKILTCFTPLLPHILKTYPDKAFEILSLINEKSVKEIKKQNALITIKEIKKAFEDKDLIEVFTSTQTK